MLTTIKQLNMQTNKQINKLIGLEILPCIRSFYPASGRYKRPVGNAALYSRRKYFVQTSRIRWKVKFCKKKSYKTRLHCVAVNLEAHKIMSCLYIGSALPLAFGSMFIIYTYKYKVRSREVLQNSLIKRSDVDPKQLVEDVVGIFTVYSIIKVTIVDKNIWR